MDRNKIIEELYKDKRFNDCISRMEPESLREDLKSEVILILLDQPERKLIELHEKGELIFFAVRTVINTIKSPRSPFYKTYRNRSLPISSNMTEAETDTNRYLKEAGEEMMLELLLRIKKIANQPQPTYVTEIMPEVSWYDQHILSLYMKLNNYRAIEKETGIPWESCGWTVRKTIDQLKKYVTPRINNTLLAGLCLLCSRGDAA